MIIDNIAKDLCFWKHKKNAWQSSSIGGSLKKIINIERPCERVQGLCGRIIENYVLEKLQTENFDCDCHHRLDLYHCDPDCYKK